jgi:CIC family chloride channel protein
VRVGGYEDDNLDRLLNLGYNLRSRGEIFPEVAGINGIYSNGHYSAPEAELIRRFSDDPKWAYVDLLAVLVGVAGGLGAVVFREFIFAVHNLFFNHLLPHAPSYHFIILLPVIGGLIVGPVVCCLAPEARGDGIPTVMEALQRRGGQIRKRVGFIIICASAVTVGSGGSAGREGPIVQIGASFGSLIGQAAKLGPREMRLLTACGVAAGIAGTFNAPMGGAVFSMEVISRRFSSYDAVPILLSSVVGKAVASELINPVPDFINPVFVFNSPDLALCFLLGPLFGFFAFLWVKSYYIAEDFFGWLPMPGKLKPALGGLVAGVSGLYFLNYGIMGVGYEGINLVFKTISSDPSNGFLFLLLALTMLKVLATASTVGSGGSGGLFAPTLYIGSMLGAIFGILATRSFPGILTEPSAYGLLGMGAFFAGAARAPLTCIVMIPEMASSYSRLPPLIISCILSYATAQILLRGGSIYLIKLMRRGVYLDPLQPLLNRVPVKEAMHEDVVTVSSKMPVSEVRDLIARYNYTGFPVVDDGESVKYSMDLMYQNGIGRIPVVRGDGSKELVGIMTRSDAIQVYEKEAKQ